MAGRKRKPTQRFGDAVNIADVSESFDEPFGDNSYDDSNYSPPHKRTRDNSFSDADQTRESEVEDMVNFNDEIEEIRRTNNMLVADTTILSRMIGESHSEQSDADPFLKLFNVVNQVLKKTDEILVRVGLIEESLIKKGELITANVDLFDKFNTFVEENKLPFMTAMEVDKFEANLKNDEFRNNAVSYIYVYFKKVNMIQC